jgi:hypothetical protein
VRAPWAHCWRLPSTTAEPNPDHRCVAQISSGTREQAVTTYMLPCCLQVMDLDIPSTQSAFQHYLTGATSIVVGMLYQAQAGVDPPAGATDRPHALQYYTSACAGLLAHQRQALSRAQALLSKPGAQAEGGGSGPAPEAAAAPPREEEGEVSGAGQRTRAVLLGICCVHTHHGPTLRPGGAGSGAEVSAPAAHDIPMFVARMADASVWSSAVSASTSGPLPGQGVALFLSMCLAGGSAFTRAQPGAKVAHPSVYPQQPPPAGTAACEGGSQPSPPLLCCNSKALVRELLLRGWGHMLPSSHALVSDPCVMAWLQEQHLVSHLSDLGPSLQACAASNQTWATAPSTCLEPLG